jgi:RNA polymerase sigma factor (sigma-70 family)
MDASARRKQLSAAIGRAAGGERAALRLIYDETAAKLFGICLRILNDRSEAEDVLQEVYLAVWQKAGAFDETKASPITWLVAIARNRAIDRLRGRGLVQRAEPIEAAETVSDPAPLAEEMLVSSQQQARLASCLDELDERTAKAIRSAFLCGATYEGLARAWNVPLGTMKSLIRRGLVKLRACLER